MRILVVAPRSATKIFPVGLAYIIAVMKKGGHQVDCVNLNLSELRIQKNRYDVVATGGLACHLIDIEQIVAMARDAGATTIIGGGIVSSEPELITRELRADFSVIGEGEVTIGELLSAIENGTDTSGIPGIAFVRDAEFVLTETRKPIKELDELPFPDYDSLGFCEHLDHLKPSDIYYLDYFDYPRAYPIVSSRSCPYECTFCYHPLGKVYRERSVDSIIHEIAETVPKYKINIIEIVDELFAVKRERLLEFCTKISKFRNTLDWDLKWGCQLRVGDIDSEILDVLCKSGCYSLSLGLESYSNIVLASMKKKICQDEIHKAIHCVMGTDLRLQGNFIFGDRAETMETAKETMDFWIEHAQAGILLGYVQPYPNCELYQFCLKEGIIKDKLDFIKYHIFDLFNMTQMNDAEFFNIRLEVLRLDFKHNRYAIPKKVDPQSVSVVCPHCNKLITYNNFSVVEKDSLLFAWRQNIFLYNKIMYCRECGRRFWARSTFTQFLTFFVVGILKYPSLAIKVMHVRNVLLTLLSRKWKGLFSRRSATPLEEINRLRNG